MLEIPTPEMIETEARAKGLSIAAVLAAADLPRSAWTRFKSGAATTIPTVQKMIEVINSAP